MQARYAQFREALKSRLLILDGSMGALLQKRNLPPGYAPDLWNLENPSVIRGVHREYREAGADILITNTFGASKLRLQEYDAYSKLRDINQRAVELARMEAGDLGFVAGDIGPCGDTIFPTGTRSFDEIFDLFREQARVLIESGVDTIIVETMFDSLDFKAALSAVRDLSSSVPLIALMTFNVDGISDTGIGPESAVAIAEGFHCDVVGANCSVGPEPMQKVIQRMKAVSPLPLCAQPNAGMPQLKNGQTVFPLGPEDMESYAEGFFKAGARILGGCCGTTPDYIRRVRRLVDTKGSSLLTDSKPEKLQRVLLSSKTRIQPIGPHFPFTMIGEKINPTGRKKVAEQIRTNNIEALMKDAIDQVAGGAHCLDVNVGVPLIDEPQMMQTTITALQNAVEVPLVIDSSFSSALEKGGVVYYGRPLLNSINAEDEKIEEVLPIAKKTGGAVLALTTETEVPETAEKRFLYAKKIFDSLVAQGFGPNDIVFDVLGLTLSAMRTAGLETFRTIEMIQKELGCPTTLGLSNTSFGLPNRSFVHQAFLVSAIQHGLSSAIMNVLEPHVAVRVGAAQLLTKRANAVDDFLNQFSLPVKEGVGGPITSPATPQPDASELDPTSKMNLDPLQREIFWDVVDGKQQKILVDIQEFLRVRSAESFPLFLNVMTPAIRYLGDLFAKRIRFIPHLVSAAEAMKAGVKLLEPYLQSGADGPKKPKETIIFATVKGDIHDIGKNICILMLRNFGYNVVDLGRNVAMEDIFKEAEKHGAQIIALSALMTTTMIQMKLLVEENRRRDLKYRVMVGGAPVTGDFAKEIGADGHCEDVGNIVGEVESVLQSLGYATFT